MPQRFLRPGITDSEKWNACDWPTQSLYVRMITLVDDFGRYDANPKLLRGHAFALRDEVTTDKVTEMCRELAKNGLALFYEVADKQYLQLMNWHENPRAEKSKYPNFDNTCKQMFTDVCKCSLPSSSSSSPYSPSPPPNGKLPAHEKISLERELERIDDQTKKIKNRYSAGDVWDDKDKQSHKKLKTRRDEILTLTGAVI